MICRKFSETTEETGDLPFYQIDDGLTRVEVHFEQSLTKLEQLKARTKRARGKKP